MWLIIALVVVFSVVAAVCVGRIARQTVFEQHVRRLQLETEQLSTELALAVTERIDALRAVISLLPAPQPRSSPLDLGTLHDTLAHSMMAMLSEIRLLRRLHLRDPSALAAELQRGAACVRIAQEALRNIERHAQATQVHMRLRLLSGTRLDLCITDDGVGFDPAQVPPGHYGIIGLRERAELIGAELQIESDPDRGTRIALALELAPVTFVCSA
jgi:glucose-6-phosphate-specific signal transduction histidine kinase